MSSAASPEPGEADDVRSHGKAGIDCLELVGSHQPAPTLDELRGHAGRNGTAVLPGHGKRERRVSGTGAGAGAGAMPPRAPALPEAPPAKKPSRDLVEARFLILRQKFLELLEQRKAEEAIVCLRSELSKLALPPDQAPRLHALASLIICATPAELRKQANWSGAQDSSGPSGAPQSREHLLAQLNVLIAQSEMVPERRLHDLVGQALTHQISQCAFIPQRDSVYTLLQDHQCDKIDVPRKTGAVLDAHTDEVWHIEFSRDGRTLATGSKDCTVILWDVDAALHDGQRHGSNGTTSGVRVANADGAAHGRAGVLSCLRGHKSPVLNVAWSSDDATLLSCSDAPCSTVMLWRTGRGHDGDDGDGDAEAKAGAEGEESEGGGRLVRGFRRHTGSIVAVAWVPGSDNQRFVSGGIDKNIFLWNVDGTVLHSWHGTRVNDLVVNSIGTHAIVSCSDKCIHMYELQGRGAGGAAGSGSSGRGSGASGKPGEGFAQRVVITEENSIMSMCLADDDRHLLLSIAGEEIRSWDLVAGKLVQRYAGQRQGRYVIRGSLGGHQQVFVASGSEDSQVYIWYRSNGALLEVLPGHSGTVNAISWNPVRPLMFASCSDDHTARIWI